MRSVDSKFYKSKAWNNVRINVWLKQHCLCGMCGKPVYVKGINDYLPLEKRTKGIVHHIEHLNEINVYNDNIAYGEDNLIGICHDCHNQVHYANEIKRNEYVFDEDGNIKPRE